MAKYTFRQRPRPKNTNQPLSFDIIETRSPTGRHTETKVGLLISQKKRWKLDWLGTVSVYNTRLEVKRQFAALGHEVEGLL